MNMLKNILGFLKDRDNLLMASITSGVLLISLGIYIMGSDIAPFIGSRLIILGSAIFYISVVLLVFCLE